MAATPNFETMPAISSPTDDAEASNILIQYKLNSPQPNLPNCIDAVLYPPHEHAGLGLPFMMQVAVTNIPSPKRHLFLHPTARMGLPLYYHVLSHQPIDGALSPETFSIQTQKTQGTLINSSHNKVLHNPVPSNLRK